MRRVTKVPVDSSAEMSSLRASLDKRIARSFGRCLRNMQILADGVTVQEAEDDGGSTIYTRPPDRAANEYILNRILGRPAGRQPIEEPAPQTPARIDLYKIPKDRLETMVRWLADTDEQTTGVEITGYPDQ
jgi:hypothetical protein